MPKTVHRRNRATPTCLPLPSAFGILLELDFMEVICSSQQEKGGTLQEVEGSDMGLPPRTGRGRSAFERLCTGSRRLSLGRPLWGRGEELYETIMGPNRKKKRKYCTKMIIKT